MYQHSSYTQDHMPQGAYPHVGYPNSGYPQHSYSQSGYPQTGYPLHGYPQSGYPLSGNRQDPQGYCQVQFYPHGVQSQFYPHGGQGQVYPQGIQGQWYPQGYPQGPYPLDQQAGGYPQGGYPQGGYPQGGYPQGGYPQGGYPQGGYPKDGYPQGGYPQGGYPPPQPGFQPAGGYGGGYGEQPMYGGQGGSLGEDADVKGFDFNEQSIRKSFIRKVYGILMCQLLVTMSFITLFVFHEKTKLWVQTHTYMFWVAFAVVFICLIAMACCPTVRRTAPMNFIFLGLFTVAESFLLGVTSSMYQSDAVLMAVGITAAVCLGLTIFAMQTKYDFTVMGGALLVATICLLLFGIVAIFFPGKVMTLLYASAGALIFSLYLIYDTQLMMGGKHKYTISPEEYVFAALNLYLDIINIFIYILTIIGAARGD